MTGPASGEDKDRTSMWGAALRQQLADLAGTIAWTEDWIADTLDRLAQTRPRDAAQLRLRAAQSRAYAAEERHRADKFSRPTPGAPQNVQRPAGPDPGHPGDLRSGHRP